jgi:hypothetical protein
MNMDMDTGADSDSDIDMGTECSAKMLLKLGSCWCCC